MQNEAGEVTLKITGKWAVLFLVLLVVFFVWRSYVVQRDAPEAVAESLRQTLAAEYMSDALRKDSEDYQGVTNLIDSVEFTSLSVRGAGNDVYVRVDILVNGGPPPDGRSRRYFKYNHSTMFGYTYEWETNALAYYLALF